MIPRQREGGFRVTGSSDAQSHAQWDLVIEALMPERSETMIVLSRRRVDGGIEAVNGQFVKAVQRIRQGTSNCVSSSWGGI